MAQFSAFISESEGRWLGNMLLTDFFLSVVTTLLSYVTGKPGISSSNCVYAYSANVYVRILTHSSIRFLQYDFKWTELITAGTF